MLARLLGALGVGLMVGGTLYAIWTAPTVTAAGALVLTGMILGCLGTMIWLWEWRL